MILIRVHNTSMYRMILLSGLVTLTGSCFNPDSKKAVNQPCVNNTDCADQICHAGICASSSPKDNGGSCTGPGECKSFVCTNGKCAAGVRPLGGNCLHNEECASNKCLSNSCAGGSGADAGDAGPSDANLDKGATDSQPPDIWIPDAWLNCTPTTPVKNCANGWCTILPGCFIMGSPKTEPCRTISGETQHPVVLTHKFEVATTETTQQDFQTLMSYNPSFWTKSLLRPVERVNWHEAAAFCNALTDKHLAGKTKCYSCVGSSSDSGVDSGGNKTVTCTLSPTYDGTTYSIYDCKGYRLPTEAEWEYAYRGGTTTAYYSGANNKDVCYKCKPEDTNLAKIAWYCGAPNSETYKVGLLQENAWGLYDMSGNVAEWVHDKYVEKLGKALVINPWGGKTGKGRAVRGGAWDNHPQNQRAAWRTWESTPKKGANDLGFRCARTL